MTRNRLAAGRQSSALEDRQPPIIGVGPTSRITKNSTASARRPLTQAGHRTGSLVLSQPHSTSAEAGVASSSNTSSIGNSNRDTSTVTRVLVNDSSRNIAVGSRSTRTRNSVTLRTERTVRANGTVNVSVHVRRHRSRLPGTVTPAPRARARANTAANRPISSNRMNGIDESVILIEDDDEFNSEHSNGWSSSSGEFDSADSSLVQDMDELEEQMTSDDEEDDILEFSRLTERAAERGEIDVSEDDSSDNDAENSDPESASGSDDEPVEFGIEEQSDRGVPPSNPLDCSVASDVIRSEDFGACTICFEDNPYDPVACLYCTQMIGCRRCATAWYNASKSSTDNHHQCPLCRADWEAGPEVDSVFVLRPDF